MRISEDASIQITETSKVPVMNNSARGTVEKHGFENTDKKEILSIEPLLQKKNGNDTKAKVQKAVNTINEMLEVNNSTSKFMFHEGLERYYVTVVNRDTEEVVKEIPPKKLLDAFYEMQKMLGMIVDEKI